MIEVTLPICTTRGLNDRMHWAKQEVQMLLEAYADRSKPVALAALAKIIGRDKANVCRKARELGLTNQRRPKSLVRKNKPKYKNEQERRAAIGRAARERIQKNGHPRGALGMRHSQETKEKISMGSRAAWANLASKLNSESCRQKRSDNLTARIVAGEMRSGYSRSRSGKRADLGNVYFRSAWEANYARYLNFLIQKKEIVSWKYEPKTFEFVKIKRGTRAYTPDFQVFHHDGTYVWHEVKGWMDAKSKTRIKRFNKYFPMERLIVIGAPWFKSANRTIGEMIVGWEKGTVRT